MYSRSKGHICWSDNAKRELYEQGGELYIAPTSNVIDLDSGNRFGRWESSDTPARREFLATHAGFSRASCVKC